MPLNSFHEAAQEAARRAAVVLEDWRPKFQVREKGRFDLVTDADLASQRTIQSFLSGRFPDHAFLGEEDIGTKSRPGADAPPTWIVDPIDGFHELRPRLSLVLHFDRPADRGRKLVVGVVLDPEPQRDVPCRQRRAGAWINERSIR